MPSSAWFAKPGKRDTLSVFKHTLTAAIPTENKASFTTMFSVIVQGITWNASLAHLHAQFHSTMCARTV